YGGSRTCVVAAPIWADPGDVAARLVADGPAVLVHELVVKRAHQHQVVEIGSAPLLPPSDVVRLGEAIGPAARELASGVAVPELAPHPGGRLPGHPPEPNRLPTFVFDHDL